MLPTFRHLLLGSILVGMLGLGGCATGSKITLNPSASANPAGLMAQEEREVAAATVAVWVGHGTLRLDQSLAPTLNWSLAVVPEGSTVTLRDSRAGKQWQYVLGPNGQIVDGSDTLAKDVLPYFSDGIDIKAFYFWLRGLRQSPEDLVTVGEDGFPTRLVSGKWAVDYTQWFPKDKYPLPQKMMLTHGKTQVEVIVKDWAWAQDDTGPDAGTIEL